jgi:hypothetical protein
MSGNGCNFLFGLSLLVFRRRSRMYEGVFCGVRQAPRPTSTLVAWLRTNLTDNLTATQHAFLLQGDHHLHHSLVVLLFAYDRAFVDTLVVVPCLAPHEYILQLP